MEPASESGHWGDGAVSAGAAPAGVAAGDLDTLFDVLAAERRRHTLRHLVAAGTTVPLTELATHVATATDDQQEVKIDLHHRHLPKLAEEGLVSYDTEANLTTATEAGRRVDRLRAALDEGDV